MMCINLAKEVLANPMAYTTEVVKEALRFMAGAWAKR